ncbi:MAG: DinB family protein, partial [Bacteroidota bacterium]
MDAQLLGPTLVKTVEKSFQLLRDRLDDERSAKSPAPGKWSPKQLIGHLIDSASNNHQRFVRANFKDDLCFPGY